jgi:hypothetical protein
MVVEVIVVGIVCVGYYLLIKYFLGLITKNK